MSQEKEKALFAPFLLHTKLHFLSYWIFYFLFTQTQALFHLVYALHIWPHYGFSFHLTSKFSHKPRKVSRAQDSLFNYLSRMNSCSWNHYALDAYHIATTYLTISGNHSDTTYIKLHDHILQLKIIPKLVCSLYSLHLFNH